MSEAQSSRIYDAAFCKCERKKMTGSSRKGLQRIGAGTYRVSSPGVAYIIRRDRPWRWLVRKEGMPDFAYDFFAIKFPRLREARAWCWQQCWPFPKQKRANAGRKPQRAVIDRVLRAAELEAKLLGRET